MDFKIIAIGKVRDRALLVKCEEYAEKIRFDAKLEIVEIKDADKATEGAKIIDHLKREKAHCIALDEKGRAFTSQLFAQRLASANRRTVFIIGGPTGLSDAVKAGVNEKLALSAMTFTHEMARMILLEQIYRGISIVKNRKYHKE